MKQEETKQRSKDVARLRATGLYTDLEIGEAFGIDRSTVSHICNEQAEVPDNPPLSFEEAARVADVNVTVIRSLTTHNRLRSWHSPEGYGVDIHGERITAVVTLLTAKGISGRWLSVEEASKIAGMLRARGMYNRAKKGQVRCIIAPEGEAFHIGKKKGLKILIDRESIKPTQRKATTQPERVEPKPEALQQELTIVIKSDMSDKPIVVPGKAITVTVDRGDMVSHEVTRMLTLTVDLKHHDDPPTVKMEIGA